MTSDVEFHPSGSRSDGAAPTEGERLPAAARREQLLAVGRQVFAENGFHDTAMTDMAKAAGVTKPVLYQHFDSKRDLYGAILRDVGDTLTEAVFAAAMSAESPREQVSSGVGAAVDFVAKNPYGFQVLLAAGSSSDPEFVSIAQGWRNSMADQIAALIVVEGMSRSHQEALAYGVVGMVESMMSRWLSSPEPELDADQLAADLTALAWSGLRGLS
ncbi:MAG: TetR/AcrR family transcriptional regulator [Acidimicrobiales bacterium]